jgi:hypothetical protein
MSDKITVSLFSLCDQILECSDIKEGIRKFNLQFVLDDTLLETDMINIEAHTKVLYDLLSYIAYTKGLVDTRIDDAVEDIVAEYTDRIRRELSTVCSTFIFGLNKYLENRR